MEKCLYSPQRSSHAVGAEVALGFSRPLFGEARLSGTEGVLISPHHKMRDADVVLILTTPSRIMRIAELYSKIEGPIVASFSGDVAVCGEGTATPFYRGDSQPLDAVQRSEVLCGVQRG